MGSNENFEIIYKIADSIGAIQHLTSIKVTGTIMMLGNDGEASIFQIANFRLMGNQFKIIAAPKEALRQLVSVRVHTGGMPTTASCKSNDMLFVLT